MFLAGCGKDFMQRQMPQAWLQQIWPHPFGIIASRHSRDHLGWTQAIHHGIENRSLRALPQDA
jgi:hypothetical protein